MEKEADTYKENKFRKTSKIHRFSTIITEKQVPYYEYYKPTKHDPVLKQEKRKLRPAEKLPKKPKMGLKCPMCKKKKKIVKEEKKIDKYVVPLTKKQIRENEERHKREKEVYFVCKKEVIRLPSPMKLKDTDGIDFDFGSPFKQPDATVIPEKISMTESTLRWPPDATEDQLKLKAPKSKIFINRGKKEKKTPPGQKAVDSFDFIYDEQYRKEHPWFRLYREPGPPPATPSVSTIEPILSSHDDDSEDVEFDGEFMDETEFILRDYPEIGGGEGEDYPIMEIEKYSAATSIDSEYRLKPPSDDKFDQGSMVPSVMDKILQKTGIESITEIIREPFKRGTLKSHSTSKLKDKPLSFYFGVRTGNFSMFEPTFSERSRGKQGLAICVLGYLFSFIKHPSRWMPKDLDKILELGDKLYLESVSLLHYHDDSKDIQPEELSDVVTIGDKQIKYKIYTADIAGTVLSTDPKVFNLLKGLTLFFQKNRACVMQTLSTNILIIRQKHYYVFDPQPRNQELYIDDDDGVATIANFYDVPSILIMLINRGQLRDWPYILSKISIKKIMTKGGDGDSITSDFREESLYKIIHPDKAVISGGLSIADSCFGENVNKQGFAVAVMALVYSHVTPSCSWHRRTIDKILLISNAFFSEITTKLEVEDLRLEYIPAFFTVGPLMIEIQIFATQFAGLMFRKAHCLFEELLTKFFVTNTSAILEIDRFVIGVWKARNMYYSFDPYPRNCQGFKCKDGTACVTMNTNIESLVATILHNFKSRDFIFKIHILKIVRINRDPEYGKFPRSYINSEESIKESLRVGDKKKLPPAVSITIDVTEFAIRHTLLEEPLEPSILEVGSYVGSLDQKYVPAMATCPTKIEVPPPGPEKIFDLDSPSLSDTQIERDKPSPLKEDSFEFKLLEEIRKEQEELERVSDMGEGFYDINMETYEGVDLEEIEEAIITSDKNIQKGRDPDLWQSTVQINTDLNAVLPFPRVILEPNVPPKKGRRSPLRSQKRIFFAEPIPTQSTELAKPCNFIHLPDDSEILYGTKNIAKLDSNYENSTPYVSIIAVAMAKKYTLTTWSTEIIDAILDYGIALSNRIEVKFAQVPKIEIPRLEIGTNCYRLGINYLFDSLIEPSILEACLEKLVFKNRENCIIVTHDYSVAVFFKRTLYYMFDGFGCNLVGLGEGPDNTGVACMFRFKNLKGLLSRFLYNKKQRESVEPTTARKFIISTIDIKTVPPESIEKMPRREKKLEAQMAKRRGETLEEYEGMEGEEEEEGEEGGRKRKPKPKNVVGYLKKGRYILIEGTEGLPDRMEDTGAIKKCHLICICAMIGIFSKPVSKWDTRRVDYAFAIGSTLFGYIDNTNFSDKRSVTNLLFDKHFFDIIIKRINIANPRNTKNIANALNYLFKKNKFLVVQYPSCCFIVYKTPKSFHVFDPYGPNGKACWMRFYTVRAIKNYFNKYNKANTFLFYTINISKLRRASKKNRLQYKLRIAQVKRPKKEKKPKIFTEDEDWLKVYPIPWSQMKKNLACGVLRGRKSHKWYNWNVEYPKDLYSLVGTLHQTSHEFSSKRRGKQTIANCIVAIIMTEIYELTEWNQAIVDSILRSGDAYFKECVQDITERNYEIKIEDFKRDLTVFPYNVTIDLESLMEGTMYIVRPKQYNLSKALRHFFESHENRTGIVCSFDGTNKPKYIAFGRIRINEFFMFDCQSIGPPMFLDKYRSKAYILRCRTLNRLLYCLTLTLRHGDFFIYHVAIADDISKSENVTKVTNYEESREGRR